MKFIKRIACVFGVHSYKCVNVFHYVDTSWGNRAESTCATYLCRTCKNVKMKDFYGAGYLTMIQLNGADN
jgi:hypothetical protein